MSTPSDLSSGLAPTASTAANLRRAWRSLARAVWPLIAILILLFMSIAAIAGPAIAPKDPNRQNIMSRLQEPMTADRTGTVQHY